MNVVGKAFCMVLTAVLLVVAGGCGRETLEFISAYPPGSEAAARFDSTEYEAVSDALATEDEKESSSICVYVCGAVAVPGVYTLPEGARAFEAVEMAGGLTEEADGRAINLARPLTDGEQVTVPAFDEEADTAAPGTAKEAKVNINRAGLSELMTLKGIGQTRAEAIVAFREENGPFACVEDVMKVSGIKSSLFEKIKDDISVG